MRFSIAHLPAAMLIVAIIAARLHSHETRDFISQVLFWLILASLAVHIAYDKSRVWMIVLWLGFGAYATWSGTLAADNAVLAIPLGCVLGVYLAHRGMRQRQAKP